MENLAFIILGSVGALFLLVLVFFIISQKKQDKMDLETNRKILDNLTIDIRSASEDLDLDAIDMEEAGELESAVDESIDPSFDDGLSVEEPLTTQHVPTEAINLKPHPEAITQKDTTPLSDHPSSVKDDFKIQSGSAVTNYEEELHIGGVSDFEYDSSKKEFDESDIEIFEIKVESEAPKLDSKQQEDFIESPAESLFEMMGNQNELVLDMDDEILEGEPAFDHNIHVKEFDDSLPEPTLRPQESQAQDQNYDEMSELDALFEVSSEVEEKVFSAKKPPLPDMEVIPGSISQTQAEPAVVPSPIPAAEPPQPPPVETVVEKQKEAEEIAATESKADTALDEENQKRHEKARRIARVIVNDIKIYNPENLALGIRNKNIMNTLGKEVERGRLLYIKRVPADIVKETNYYREALIKILADGKPELLGL